MTTPEAAPLVPAAAAREGLWAAVGILVALGLLKHGASLPVIGAYVFTVAAAIQLYWPLWRIGRGGVSRESLGLKVRSWRRELGGFFGLSALTVVFYGGAMHGIYTYQGLSPTWALPDRWPGEVAVQLLGVALPEELFFRAYLQERLSHRWPARPGGRWWQSLSRAVVAAAAVFALAHVVGDYRLSRLGPFFPGLLFGALRVYTGSIWSAVGYHALCNLLQQLLFASYHP